MAIHLVAIKPTTEKVIQIIWSLRAYHNRGSGKLMRYLYTTTAELSLHRSTAYRYCLAYAVTRSSFSLNALPLRAAAAFLWKA